MLYSVVPNAISVRGRDAAGSTATFIATVTIIPFMPDGWDPAAGFPAMTGNVPFLMKDLVLLAVSLYLLKQDVTRVTQQ
jgi:uncharacterized membrane protein YkgB